MYLYTEVSSTLDVARTLSTEPGPEQGVVPWTSILAHSQHGGRGQLRRGWDSPPGNIYAALRLPNVEPFLGTACAPATGTLVAMALRRMGIDAWLKWPNDIVLLQGAQPFKVGGILIEAYKDVIWAGIGVNLVSSPPAVSLRHDHALRASHVGACISDAARVEPCGESFHNVCEFWLSLVINAFSWYECSLSMQSKWHDAAEAMLLWRGKPVLLCDEEHSVQGTLAGLGPQGGLRIEGQGQTEFFSGSLRP